MYATRRNVCTLIRVQSRDRRPRRNSRFASDNHPVLGSVLVTLKAQSPSGSYLYTLDLEAGPFFQRSVRTPRALHREVKNVLWSRAPRQLVNDLSNLLPT